MPGRLRKTMKGAVLVLGLVVVGLLAGCLEHGNDSRPIRAVINAEPRQGQAPLEVTFDGGASHDRDGKIEDWLWDFADGSGVVSGREVQHTFTRPGEYTVTLVTVGPSGVGRASTTVRTLNNPPMASFTFYPRDPFEGESVTFDGSESYDPDGEIVRWMWDFGDGGVGEGTYADHVFALPGTYTVRLTVEDDQGAQASTSRTVTVDDCSSGRCGRR